MNSLIGLIIVVLDIIAIIDVVRSTMATDKKVLWVLGILVFPLIGMVLYYVLLRRNAIPSRAIGQTVGPAFDITVPKLGLTYVRHIAPGIESCCS